MNKTILYVALRYDYGVKERGNSYEYDNMEDGFRECSQKGLFDLKTWHPDENKGSDPSLDGIDYIFHVSFNDSYDLPLHVAKDAIAKGIPVIQWDCDSSWRFNNWILPRKDRVTHFITTHSQAINWYRHHGLNVLLSQWGASPNHIKARKIDRDSYKYDCSFLGQNHGTLSDGRTVRGVIAQRLIDAGLDFHLAGNYWDGFKNWHGYLSNTEDTFRFFNDTKVNINISNPFVTGTPSQQKGRHHQLPAIGAFQITTPADKIEEFYEPNKEIIIVGSVEELIDKTKYYISHDQEREQIALNAYNRAITEHTFEQRISKIIDWIG